jgi:hypothetical protein
MIVTLLATARSKVARRSSRAISRRVPIPLSPGYGSGNRWSQQCLPLALAPMTMKRRQGRPMARSLPSPSQFLLVVLTRTAIVLLGGGVRIC